MFEAFRARNVIERGAGHSLLIAVALPSLAVGVRLTHPGVRFTAVVIVLGLVTVGIPHGQFDWPAARARLQPVLGRRWLPIFLAGYLGLAGLAVAVWAASLAWGLALFLLLSALHFGLEDVQARVDAPGLPGWLIGAVRGAVPLMVVAAAHSAGVSRLIAVLLDVAPSTVAPWVEGTVRLLAPAWAAGFAALVAFDLSRRRTAAAAELLAVVVSLTLLPPVLGFALWFTLVHSIRHLLQVAAERRAGTLVGLAAPLARGAAVSCALLAAGAAATLWLPWTVLFRAAVVGMAGLTLPHLVACLSTGRSAAARRADADQPQHGRLRQHDRQPV